MLTRQQLAGFAPETADNRNKTRSLRLAALLNYERHVVHCFRLMLRKQKDNKKKIRRGAGGNARRPRTEGGVCVPTKALPAEHSKAPSRIRGPPGHSRKTRLASRNKSRAGSRFDGISLEQSAASRRAEDDGHFVVSTNERISAEATPPEELLSA